MPTKVRWEEDKPPGPIAEARTPQGPPPSAIREGQPRDPSPTARAERKHAGNDRVAARSRNGYSTWISTIIQDVVFKTHSEIANLEKRMKKEMIEPFKALQGEVAALRCRIAAAGGATGEEDDSRKTRAPSSASLRELPPQLPSERYADLDAKFQALKGLEKDVSGLMQITNELTLKVEQREYQQYGGAENRSRTPTSLPFTEEQIDYLERRETQAVLHIDTFALASASLPIAMRKELLQELARTTHYRAPERLKAALKNLPVSLTKLHEGEMDSEFVGDPLEIQSSWGRAWSKKGYLQVHD